MASTPHDAKKRSEMQAMYTASTTAVSVLKAAGVNSAAAAAQATANDQQVAILRESTTPLS